ncbi:MAG: protein kinase, partial [Gemmatimonadales bacterium]
MNCSRCGAEVQPEWKACPSCGLGLSPTTPVQALLSGDLSELDVAREALGEDYEILEELGRGGMAIVYRARERQLDREVAVKILPLSLAFDEEFVERFEQEARTAAQLEHPNIIPIYRVGKSGRISYFVMKYLRGRSLSELLAERGRIKPVDIRRMLIETAGALGYAAERGIVHRDVKPDNFIFDEFGVCVVTDFGIAKAASAKRLTGTGMSIGTPHYMSPEQARAQALDGRSDLYSLGIVAYQCLTGTVPYDGEDSFSIGYAHIMDPLPTPTLVSAEERNLYRVIRAMMAKDPKDRFQSCHDVVSALRGDAPIPEPMPAPARPPLAGGRPGTPGVPSITTQPTTPLPALIATGPRTPTAISATPTRRAFA